MKQDAAYIAVVLDRSGSMEAVKEATIDGINEFIKQQQAIPGDCRFFLAQFDDIYEVVYDSLLADVKPFTALTYMPRGMTALNDAIGKTINSVGETLKSIPEADRPGRIVVAIITDGHENHSKEFTQAKVAEMVKHQQDVYKWNFIFIGANQDAVLTAKQYHIDGSQAATYSGSATGTTNVMAAMACNVSGFRSAPRADSSKIKWSKQQRSSAMA